MVPRTSSRGALKDGDLVMGSSHGDDGGETMPHDPPAADVLVHAGDFTVTSDEI